MKVVTFGEGLFRLATHKGERLKSAENLNFYLGGTELNIAANLRSLGVKTTWVSCLPSGLTGELVKNRIEHLGVDYSHCMEIENGQIGWYLMETGAVPRPDRVYHRNAGSIAHQKSFTFDWKTILTGANLFHTSGIAAGLSQPLRDEVKKAMQAARSASTLVSYDFNYRKNIWSIEDFVKHQKDLLPLIDILFCSEKELELFFQKDPQSKDYSAIFNSTTPKMLVLTDRTADESEYGIKVITPKNSFVSKHYKFQSIDRIGIGDSMAAGFMKAYLEHKDEKLSCEWGAVAGALKYGIAGDMALLSENEIKSILNDGIKGIIR